MKVLAIADGFYGKYIHVGDEFEVEDGLTASWFVPTEAEAKKQAEEEAKAKAEAEAKKQAKR